MSTNSERITGANGRASRQSLPLLSIAQTRALEAVPRAVPGADSSLMQVAGLALAKLTLALAPHARTIWVACGPGNNGGDGLEAAAHLQRWGKQVVVSMAHDPEKYAADARHAWASAQAAQVRFTDAAPELFDACIDAMFGIGALRPLQGVYADWAQRMNQAPVPTIAADIPSGLHADTGSVAGPHVVADVTLSLLTLKPGLFTGNGRDACGEVWFNDLGMTQVPSPCALLQGPTPDISRLHASHKGSYGDVYVIGGAAGMVGAALLAGRSALLAGAGRVFVCALDAELPLLDGAQPELMLRRFEELAWKDMTVVAGCGGGLAILQHLTRLLREARMLVLDADALNRIAEDAGLQAQLAQRPCGSTIITPHPLEAARLLGNSVTAIQADRLTAAQALARRYQCVVVLKGSGSIIAAPQATPRINATGNAKLASAGTGDVLAGLVGASLAGGMGALEAAAHAVYRHGLAAERWPGSVLAASELCRWA